MNYWAKISEDNIVIYSEEYLGLTNTLQLRELKLMQKSYKEFQRRVELSQEKKEALKRNGVNVLMDNFFALEGEWHWFTGHNKMDAFRLTPPVERIVKEKGFFEVRFRKEGINRTDYKSVIDLSSYDPKETLFVVGCTKQKVWDYDPTAPDFVSAKYAYRGKDFLDFLRWAEKNEIEKKGFRWVILSGKYGFIEPWHPISRYDEKLGDPNYKPISDDSLKNQVEQKRWWRDVNGQLEEIRLTVFTKIIAANCNEEYVNKIKHCFPSGTVCVFSFSGGYELA
jgi:hypothetical protein